MSSKKFARTYPSLDAYLEWLKTAPVRPEPQSAIAQGCFALASLVPLSAIGGGVLGTEVFRNPLAALVLAFGAAAGAFFVIAKFTEARVKALRKPRTAEEAMLLKAKEAGVAFAEVDKKGKLHRWLDPVAGQLLEAGAYHWKRVHDRLELTAWTHGDLPEHWKGLRDRARSASDQAMAELFTLCSGCIGEPGKTPEDELKGVFEDFAGLEIQDALQGLTKVLSRKASDYTFTSPETPLVFEPARQLAERLKSLADEVEAASAQAKAEAVGNQFEVPATESIDALLTEFRAVRQAEEELDTQHLQDRL